MEPRTESWSSDAIAARADRLIEEREDRGITWAMYARLIYFAAAGLSIPFNSAAGFDMVISLIIVSAGLAVVVASLGAAKRGERMTKYGVVGTSVEIVGLLLLPISWYFAVGGFDVPFVFFHKGDSIFIGLTLIAINSLALRPLYPLVMTAVVAVQQSVFLLLAALDPRTITTWEALDVFFTPAIHPVFSAWRILTIVVTGGFMCALAAIARNMVRRSVHQEIERFVLEEKQSELISQAKMAGLQDLVAGLAHEINSPLGALVSGAGVARASSQKIKALLDDAADIESVRGDRKMQRALGALEDADRSSHQAAGRISNLIGALKQFSRLDAAEWDRLDLASSLRAAVELAGTSLTEKVKVTEAIEDVPEVFCRPAEINQVLLTIVKNALEAMSGEGDLLLGLEQNGDDRARIVIEDSGPGIPEALMPGLFELELHRQGGRVKMGLGLPVGHRIIQQHGGQMTVKRATNGGARFELELPIHPATAAND